MCDAIPILLQWFARTPRSFLNSAKVDLLLRKQVWIIQLPREASIKMLDGIIGRDFVVTNCGNRKTLRQSNILQWKVIRAGNGTASYGSAKCTEDPPTRPEGF